MSIPKLDYTPEFHICYTCNIGFRNEADYRAHQARYGCDAERRVAVAAKGFEQERRRMADTQPPLSKRISGPGRRMLIDAYKAIHRESPGETPTGEVADLFSAWGIVSEADKAAVRRWAKQGL